MNINGVSHVLYRIYDREAASKFFVDAFGCELMERGPVSYAIIGDVPRLASGLVASSPGHQFSSRSSTHAQASYRPSKPVKYMAVLAMASMTS